MNYLSFREGLRDLAVFSIRDIFKVFPHFDTRRLVEWQDKGYIQKLINKWYLFTGISVEENLRYRIANCLCRPSYISLESALSHYDLIPEGVFTLQSITTKRTASYQTVAGNFHYRNIKPQLFFGYRTERDGHFPVLMAEPEKAILDFLYLNPRIRTLGDLEDLRLNIEGLNSLIDWQKLKEYLTYFDSITLTKRASFLEKINVNANLG